MNIIYRTAIPVGFPLVMARVHGVGLNKYQRRRERYHFVLALAPARRTAILIENVLFSWLYGRHRQSFVFELDLVSSQVT